MFTGVFTALVTPFTKTGEIDEPALRRLVDFQIKNKVQGLVPMGTTGESPTVSHEEHNKVIDIVIDQAKGRVPVIAGAGSNSTEEAIILSRHAKQAGAAATLQVAPYYNKPTQEGFYGHFTAIADAVDLPLIVYNIPGRSAKNIENTTMLRLAQHKNIVGVKEASGDISQIMDLIMRKPADFIVLSGDDNLVFTIMALGGSGVVSVASNLIPAEMAAFVEHALRARWEQARETHYKLLPLFEETYRLPMCPMEAANKEKLRTVLQEQGLL
jgi:4-hydroxy-tetrahydrodipicolinate synthase